MRESMAHIHDDHRRLLSPLFNPGVHSPPPRASDLSVVRCDPQVARDLNQLWHSRLPQTQQGPWMLAFAAHYEWTAFAVALWHNPSARNLPATWLELRRLAVAPDAPHCTASFMLGRMRKWIASERPEITRLVSYQDMEVHTGTIYRAAGWHVGAVAAPRQRDRAKARRGTRRDYRVNLNGERPDAAGKYRWERPMNPHTATCCREDCSAEVDTRRAWTKIQGWDKFRAQGGSNAIALRRPMGEWMCDRCMEKEKAGIAPGQGGLW